jgi:hypothetical protein
MEALIKLHEEEPPTRVTTAAELDEVLRRASDEARERGMLNVIFIEARDGNTLMMVVGGDETVLGFTYGYRKAEYHESRGSAASDDPVMQCYSSFTHPITFPRRSVIPLEAGMRALQEFVEIGALPTCVSWAKA